MPVTGCVHSDIPICSSRHMDGDVFMHGRPANSGICMHGSPAHAGISMHSGRVHSGIAMHRQTWACRQTGCVEGFALAERLWNKV